MTTKDSQTPDSQEPKTILLVEDDDMLLAIADETLSLAGYQVITARDGQEALDVMKQTRPDLILSDIRMPRVDGIELFLRVRREPTLTEIPFMFVSAKAENADLRKGLSLGADDYITKPYCSDDLLCSIRSRLERVALLTGNRKRQQQFLTRVLPHELRTPLAGIMGYAELMTDTADQGAPLPPHELKEYGENLRISGARLLRVADDFSLWAWLEATGAGRKFSDETLSRTWMPTDRLINSFAKHAQAYQRIEDLRVNLEQSEVQVLVEGLETVINHLVENALKFSRQGTPIVIAGRATDTWYELSVSDQGTGMSDTEIANISPLRQFDRERREQQGLGMGLVLARTFADVAGGKFALEPNTSGIGLTARLSLRRPTPETERIFK